MILRKKGINLTRGRIIKSAACPFCHAAAGMPCIDGTRLRDKVHAVRVDAAENWVRVMIAAVKAVSEPTPPNKTVRSNRSKSKASKKTAADFYSSWEWKEARFAAFKSCGRKCLCCGWSPDQGGANHLVVDHIKPMRKHPHLALDRGNHQVLCNDCNMGKSYKHCDDFRG